MIVICPIFYSQPNQLFYRFITDTGRKNPAPLPHFQRGYAIPAAGLEQKKVLGLNCFQLNGSASHRRYAFFLPSSSFISCAITRSSS
jgi:hypothetical protein